MIAGIDEAGRGCVLGPLVIAVCVIDEKDEAYFKDLGITDSKLILKAKRKELFEVIKKKAIEYKIIAVSAQELNLSMQRYSLNEIEAQTMMELLFSLKNKVSKVVIDCPDTTPLAFKKRIDGLCQIEKYKNILDNNFCIEHKADLNHIVASCASILAKVTRDELLKELTCSDISGYSSDERTIKYITEYVLENKCLPETARTKWSTIDKIMKNLYQKKIGWFCDRKS